MVVNRVVHRAILVVHRVIHTLLISLHNLIDPNRRCFAVEVRLIRIEPGPMCLLFLRLYQPQWSIGAIYHLSLGFLTGCLRIHPP